jgi:hypothetical protein
MFSFEAIQILIFLVPGFISEVVFNSLQVRKAKSDLGQVVEALIFSLIVYSIFSFIPTKSPIISVALSGSANSISWNPQALSFLIVIGFLVPMPISFFMTNDIHMRALRSLKVTSRTSKETVWLDCFVKNQRSVVVNFVDGRRITGFPALYSDNDESKYLYLLDPAWIEIDDLTKKSKFVEIPQEGMLITPSMAIESIIFIRRPHSGKGGLNGK